MVMRLLESAILNFWKMASFSSCSNCIITDRIYMLASTWPSWLAASVIALICAFVTFFTYSSIHISHMRGIASTRFLTHVWMSIDLLIVKSGMNAVCTCKPRRQQSICLLFTSPCWVPFVCCHIRRLGCTISFMPHWLTTKLFTAGP